MKRQNGAHGLLLLDKRAGQTSFQSLSSVKRALGTGRVGHCGTLDKFAEGLLIVLVGSSTRLVPWFTGCDKTYEARVLFGEETDTLDPEGSVIARAPLPSKEALLSVLPSFSGDILQAPPSYSAIHIDGKRAWQRVRDGEELSIPKRPVHIQEISLLDWRLPYASLRVRCSSGTYIRSLARDLALALGSRARLEALVRTSIAGFTKSQALRIPEPREEAEQAISSALVPLSREELEASCLRVLELDENELQVVRHGRPLPERIKETLSDFHDDVALVCSQGLFVAMLRKESGQYRYACVNGALS